MDIEEIGAGASAPASFPPYRRRWAGPCIILAFADTVHEDYARARDLRPNARIVAVNAAATAFKADIVFSLHCGADKLGTWCSEQAARFGPCEVHSAGPPEAWEDRRRKYPWVDYWWREARGVGTSAWAARRLAGLIGFSEAILCGMPLERRPYGDGTMAIHFRHEKVFKIYREFIKGDTAWHPGTYGMSGWTRRQFGEPPIEKETRDRENLASSTEKESYVR